MQPGDGRYADEVVERSSLPSKVNRDPDAGEPRWVSQAIWAFIVLGVSLRVIRYALNFPLWSDEAFVAANFLDRDYLGLLRPLDYGQICPVLFLWVERALVGLLGFSEATLRLFPLVCGVACVFLFRRVAASVTHGLPLLLAVGVFAVSVSPVRNSSQVKPYSSDLLAALLLLTTALSWLNDRERTGRLWVLVALAPLTLMLSHPAVFVAGGVSLGLASSVWRTGRRQALVPFLAFNLATAACFGVLYVLIMRPQAAEMAEWRLGYWGGGFPPLKNPVALARWLVAAHTGKMLAYPFGGNNGGSTPSFLLAVAGAAVLWRQRHRATLVMLLTPFGLTLVAAAFQKYPYGVDSRQMQYVAPAMCLLVGLGAASLCRSIPVPGYRLLTTWLLTLGLVVSAALSLAHDFSHPFSAHYDVKSRGFARSFWPELARDAEVACLFRDFGVYERRWFNMYSAYYLCNQAIYSPPLRRGLGTGGPRWEAVSESRPLRCVLFNGTPVEHPQVIAWLAAMKTRYELRRTDRRVLDMADPGGPRLDETIVIFEFVPGPGAEIARSAPGGTVRR